MIAESAVLPEQVGFSTARLRRVDEVFEEYIERGVIAGAVTLVARHSQTAQLAAYGYMDQEAGKVMRRDAIFRLASMTKPVVAVAVMLLLEEGKLLVTEPVSKYIPAFKRLQVAVPNPAQPRFIASALPNDGYHLVPAEREITIRDLLTHTSGLGSATSGPSFAASTELIKAIQPTDSLSTVVPRMAGVPLSFQPGAHWEYSGLFGFDTLAHLVEVVSGVGFAEFLQERVFGPLGMRSTGFQIPAARVNEVAAAYERGPNGLQRGNPNGILAFATQPTVNYTCGGGGLAGTAEDYARFALMLANGGVLDGERVLSRKTVELMASNHIGQLPWDRPVSDLRGYRFGLGVRVLDDPGEAASMASRGTFGWAGAFGTNSWIDPVEGMVGIMLIQRMPDQEDQELRTLWPRFQNTVYQALE